MGIGLLLLVGFFVGVADAFALITYVFGRSCYNMIIGEEDFDGKTILYAIVFAIVTIIMLVGIYALTPLGLFLWGGILWGILYKTQRETY